MKATVTRYDLFKGLPHWFELRIDERKVKVYEEYKVYDFNGILGSVGGSLGLFIGFSFLDMMICLLSRVKKWSSPASWYCNKKKKQESFPTEQI